MRSVMKEGSFALEWTGAAPVVATKQLTMVRDVDDDDIALVMRQRASAFRSCYESALRANADIAGSVDVTFTIDAAGSVQKPFVHPQAGLSLAAAAPLTRCVKDTLKRTRFAPVPSPTQVTRRLTFRRQTTI